MLKLKDGYVFVCLANDNNIDASNTIVACCDENDIERLLAYDEKAARIVESGICNLPNCKMNYQDPFFTGEYILFDAINAKARIGAYPVHVVNEDDIVDSYYYGDIIHPVYVEADTEDPINEEFFDECVVGEVEDEYPEEDDDTDEDVEVEDDTDTDDYDPDNEEPDNEEPELSALVDETLLDEWAKEDAKDGLMMEEDEFECAIRDAHFVFSRDDYEKYCDLYNEYAEECQNDGCGSHAEIANIGVDGDSIKIDDETGIVSGVATIYSIEDGVDYEDDFEFEYNKNTGEFKHGLQKTEFAEFIDTIEDMLKENLETNFI